MGSLFYMNDYYGINYPKYFETDHWKGLKMSLIWKNPKAKCFCCGGKIKEWLLFHHTRYDNLFAEKLYRDGYILCYKCHSRVHRWLLFLWKLPLKRKLLVWHVRALKSIYAIRHRQIRLFLLYFSICIGTALFAIISGVLNGLFRLIYHTILYKKSYLKRKVSY